MRLHEALKRFNVGLETAAQFLASRGMPLESKDVNARIRDFQASALSREFGYTYSSTPTPSPRRKNEETPEVKRILEEIKNPQIRNYAPNMIQTRKESASLVEKGHSASNVTIKT